MGWKRLRAVLRFLFVAAGIAFMVLAFTATADRARGSLFPGYLPIVFSGVSATLAVYALYRGWISLLPQVQAGALARGFYLAQLGKYMPGAVWQAVGQVGYAVRAGVPSSVASTAFPLQALILAAGGGALGATMVLFPESRSSGTGLLPLAGLLLLLPLRRRWLLVVFKVLGRLVRREFPERLVPAQSAIFRSWGWGVIALLLYAVAFALPLEGVSQGQSFALSLVTFSFAWTVGFLALPFPTGIGVREAVLLAALAPQVVAAEVITASVYQRLITMGAEVLMIGLSVVFASRLGSRHGDGS